MIDQTLSRKISNMSTVCSMLVVLLHIGPRVEIGSSTWFVDRFFNDGLGRAAVPFFFVASGFFLARHVGEEGWWIRSVRKRVRTLIVPYLFWNLLWLLMLATVAVSANVWHGRSAFSGLTMPILDGPFSLPPLVPTWYLRALFLFVVLSPLFVKCLARFGKTTIAVVALLYAAFYRSSGIPLGTWRAIPNTLLPLEGLVYFLVGMKLAMDGDHREVPRRLALVSLGIAIVVTVLRIHCKADGNVFLYNHTRFLVVPGFLWLLWAAVPSTPWPQWITSSSIAIYLIHPFVIFWFRKLAHSPIDGFMPYCACVVLAIIAPIAVKRILLLISKNAACLVFGGR